MGETFTKERLWAELDGLLETEIKARLATGIWGDEKRRLVQLYLDEKALARQRAADAEAIAIARSGTDAAWDSAKAAKGANTRATVAIIISIVALVIAATTYIKTFHIWW